MKEPIVSPYIENLRRVHREAEIEWAIREWECALEIAIRKYAEPTLWQRVRAWFRQLRSVIP